jgi:hypothetical protein
MSAMSFLSRLIAIGRNRRADGIDPSRKETCAETIDARPQAAR